MIGQLPRMSGVSVLAPPGRLGAIRGVFRSAWRFACGRPRLDKSLAALAALEADELSALGESGLQLRREARRTLYGH